MAIQAIEWVVATQALEQGFQEPSVVLIAPWMVQELEDGL